MSDQDYRSGLQDGRDEVLEALKNFTKTKQDHYRAKENAKQAKRFLASLYPNGVGTVKKPEAK